METLKQRFEKAFPKGDWELAKSISRNSTKNEEEAINDMEDYIFAKEVTDEYYDGVEKMLGI